MITMHLFADEFDRELAVTERSFEVEMTEAALYEKVAREKLMIDIARGELKVMSESGSNDDMLYLLEAASKEAVENNPGVTMKVWMAVKSFFVSIANSIQKLFTGKNMQLYNKIKSKKSEVEVPADIEGVLTTIEKAAQEIERAATSPKFLKFSAIAGSIGAILGATAIGKKIRDSKNGSSLDDGPTKKIPIDKAKSMLDRIRNISEKIGEWIDTIKDKFFKKKETPAAATDTNTSARTSTGNNNVTTGDSAKTESVLFMEREDSDSGVNGFAYYKNQIMGIINWIIRKLKAAIFGEMPSNKSQSGPEPKNELATESVSDEIDPITALLNSLRTPEYVG